MSAKNERVMTPVEQAATWSQWMVAKEARGPGDIDHAMRRIEARYGIPYAVLWALRYRRPADILAGAFLRIQAAHEDMCSKQQRALRNELETVTAKTRAAQALMRAARRLAGEDGG